MTRRKFRRAKGCRRRLPRIEQLQIRSKGHSEGSFCRRINQWTEFLSNFDKRTILGGFMRRIGLFISAILLATVGIAFAQQTQDKPKSPRAIIMPTARLRIAASNSRGN